MKRSNLRLFMAGTVLSCVGSAATAGNFGTDVNAAIDAGLSFSRTNNYFTTDNGANGLSLLALLEKETIPPGYNGLTASDKQLAQYDACILISSGSYGARGGFYSYYDGQTLMGLSVYLETGGPDQPASTPGYNCSGQSARATIDKVVDRAIAQQNSISGFGQYAGYWGYASTGYDSSTTQYTLAGLSAAKGFYASKGESAVVRIPKITAALDLISGLYNGSAYTTGYAANGKDQTGTGLFTNCGTSGCYGHGYQAYYGAGNNSSQQTASGTWGQLTGTGKNVNDLSIQRYLHWLQNAYNYNTNAYPDSWPASYFYYLWSSSKAYNIIHNSNIAPATGNIGSDDIGKLPALTVGVSRLANLDTAAVTRPASRGTGAAGFYTGEPKGWYFDYAYRLMSIQNAAGTFTNPNGSFNAQVDHNYGMLVLERSLGGACIDSDNDGVCDSTDNCVNVANPDQANNDNDLFGNACDNCPNVPNNDQKDTNGNGIGDACDVAAKDCDVDKNGVIDNVDIGLIKAALGLPPSSSTDPRNPDHNGIINTNDVKICIGRLGK